MTAPDDTDPKDAPENSAANQRGRPFRKGRSGNPAGKPKGARSRVTIMAEQLMQDEAEAVTRAVIKAAKSGDITAARVILDRIAPARKSRPVNFDLPKVDTAADVLTALGALITAVAAGTLTPEEGATVANLLEIKRRAIETMELEARIIQLEERDSR